MVAAITSASIQNKRLSLFYAPRSGMNITTPGSDFFPGFFTGVESNFEIDDNIMLEGYNKMKIDWQDIKATDYAPDPSCLGVSCSGNGLCYEGKR